MAAQKDEHAFDVLSGASLLLAQQFFCAYDEIEDSMYRLRMDSVVKPQEEVLIWTVSNVEELALKNGREVRRWLFVSLMATWLSS